jgi:TolB protein
MLIQRRTFLTASVGMAWGLQAQAQFRVEISGVGMTQLPIALPKFRDETVTGAALSDIVHADLERSGYFKIVDANGVSIDETSTPNYSDWRAKQADALAGGSAMRLADGRYDVRFRLWDVVRGKEISATSFVVPPKGDSRLAAHRIADAIYEQLMGDKGVFSTRIAYVGRTGPKSYNLWIADADGEGAQSALASTQPIISPAWSPNGDDIAYVSFESGKAVVFIQNLRTRERMAIASFRGSNSAPAWSPDGKQLALTLSRDGGSQIYVMGRGGDNLRRLTTSASIDTEATWAPDGRSIYFVSDRGGAPQIYRMDVNGGSPERVTFQGTYNISPTLSSDGKMLAYVSRDNGSFRLQLLDMARNTVTGLTDTGDDESPSFAPNGKLIMYATREKGKDVLMTTTLDGKIKAKLASSTGDVREPVWGPFGR